MAKRKRKDEKPRVTSILNCVGIKDGLIRWYGKNGTAECERVKRESSEFGTKVHKYVEEYLKEKKEPEETSREAQVAKLIIRWIKDTRLTPLVEPETEVSSEAHNYQGHPDVIAVFEGNQARYVVDWKTSNKIDDNYVLQLAAYALAYYEMTGEKVDDGVIVRVAKDPNAEPQFEVKEYHNLFADYVPLFIYAKSLHDFYTRRNKWETA